MVAVFFSGPTLLAFSYVMQECGALFGTLLVALSGAMAVFTGVMLMEAADDRGTATYDGTVSNVLGRIVGSYIHLSVIGMPSVAWWCVVVFGLLLLHIVSVLSVRKGRPPEPTTRQLHVHRNANKLQRWGWQAARRSSVSAWMSWQPISTWIQTGASRPSVSWRAACLAPKCVHHNQ